MNPRALLTFFETRAKAGRPLVQVSVYATEGSTYSKTGALMLIDADGVYRGMLSGGCLEGDLAIRAGVVIESGATQDVTYDLSGDDELWGLGVGCDGLMRMFLQPLTVANDYAPFASIARTLRGDTATAVATVVRSASSHAAPGATAVATSANREAYGVRGAAADALLRVAADQLGEGRSALRSLDLDGHAVEILCSVVRPPPRVLLLGAGHDVEPLVRFCDELGWRATVVDHRPAYIDGNDFAGADACHCFPVEELSRRIELERFDAAVVMSHHLASDRAYLRQLAATGIPYIGLLGPGQRRERLLADLGDTAASLEDRLHGPAGLDLGGRGPEPIALSIAAELQLHLARLSG